MSFDWSEYLGLAKYLSGKSDTHTQEAALRSATSRAYYAAFCSARSVAERRLGFAPTRTGEDHKRLRKHYTQLGIIEVAKKLGEMCRWRKQCDYDEEVQRLEIIANSAIRYSKDVLRLLKWPAP
jgi:uncharacterized protein (UPF0332 family)